MKKKTVVLVTACVLVVVVCVIGGSLAWLLDKTEPVVNTFTPSNINITLAESVDTDEDGAESFQMIPGFMIQKDPLVTVDDDSEDCWLFVEVVKSATFDDYMTCGIADGWTAGEGENGIPTNVYYRKVYADDADKTFYVLTGEGNDTYANGVIKVKDTVTKQMMNDLSEPEAGEPEAVVQPTLTFTAYASQLYKSNEVEFTVAEAWANLNVNVNP